MDKIILYFFVFLGIALIALGIYLTIVSREDQTKHNVPDWIKKHVKTLKWVGPSLIGVGVLALAGSGWSLSYGMHYPNHGGASNFGFKFY